MMTKEISPQRAAVMAVLAQTGRPMRPIEIAAATGMKPGNVAMMLLRMRTDGQTEHAPSGRWQLTDKCAVVRSHHTPHDTAFSNEPSIWES